MQSILAALAIHISINSCYSSNPTKASAKKQVIALFEEDEKKRETKNDIKLRARL